MQIHRGAVRKNTWMPHPRGTVALLHRSVPQVGIDPCASASPIEMLRILSEVEATIPQASRFVELEGRAAKGDWSGSATAIDRLADKAADSFRFS